MPGMKIGWDAVAGVDWDGLFHAYGPAGDTPAHLRALTGGDADAQRAALDHLWSAVIHQGTPWSVTPPAALVVAGLLPDPALVRPVAYTLTESIGDAPPPLRATLVNFLGAVAVAGSLAARW